MEYIIIILRVIILVVVATIFLGIIYIFVMMASEDDEGNRSVKTFFLNVDSCLVDLYKLVVYVVVLLAFVWCYSFFAHPPCVNLVTEAGEGWFWLSDSSMVCDSNDSTAYYTVKSMSTDTPGRFTRCIRCGRIYQSHTRWLTEDERRLRQTTDEINSEIATGLLVDPL